MNICEHLTATARLFPEREAICFEGQRYTYAQLDRLSASASQHLTEAGIRRGDRVALMLPNVPAFVVWYYAALRLGAIAVSISTRLAASEVAFVVKDSGAKTFVSLASALATVRSELPSRVDKIFSTSDCGQLCDGQPMRTDNTTPSTWVETDPHEAALILYTSGTTGFAKGATLSHLNVRSNVHAFNHLCNMNPDQRILLSVPLFHCFGQNALLNSAFNVGATLVLQRRFDLNEAKRLIADHQVTQLYGVPMMFQLFLDSCQKADLASVNYCFSAAATLPIQVSNLWNKKFGMPINEGYGLTETSPFASYNHHLQFVPGSIGTPIDLVEMKIVDTDTGHQCAVGELGEIAIRGPNVMLGYWNRPQDTEDAIRDGWFHSGDIGLLDERGFYYIVDRVKDMIAVGGLKVYPAEVERVLLDHADVSQVAVVGVPEPVFGEQVVAFVVLSENAQSTEQSFAQILQHAKANLARYKVPRKLIPIDELPRNPSGKVLKTVLRQSDTQGIKVVADDASAATGVDQEVAPVVATELRQPTLRKQLAAAHAASRGRIANLFVQQLVQQISGGEELPATDARFLDAGLDSLMLVEISSQIQVELGPQHEVPTTLVFDHPRICDLADYLVAALMMDQAASEPNRAELSDAAVDSQQAAVAGLTRRQQIASMTEAEALAELQRELDS